MKISDLYGIHKGKTIFVVGTGPSLRLFPVSYLKDQITIGLNQAWLNVKTDYLLTIHPETLPNPPNHYKVVTKIKGRLTGKEPYYFFESNKNVKDFNWLISKENYLYVGRGIQTAGLALAAKMGASYAVLVGCDMLDLGGDHHATPQSVQFHGLQPAEVYREYYLNTCLVRQKLLEWYGMETLCLSPLIGNRPEEDYARLRTERNLNPLPSVRDISTYDRNGPDFE